MAIDDALTPAGDPQNESEFSRGMVVSIPDAVSEESIVAEIPAPAGGGSGYPRSRLIANA